MLFQLLIDEDTMMFGIHLLTVAC